MRLYDANPAIYDMSYQYKREPLTQEEATRLAQPRCEPLSDRRVSRRRPYASYPGLTRSMARRLACQSRRVASPS